jgi:hypothetical protein
MKPKSNARREMHPSDAVLGRAVPIGIGNKLLFVESFCDANRYPNLACPVLQNDAALRNNRNG